MPKKTYHHLKVEPSLWAFHYGSQTVCRVPDAHGKDRYAHGKAHTTTRHQQSRPLPCARYRAHDKALPCANLDPRQKKASDRKGDVAQALLCALPTWHMTKFESLPCAVVIAHGKDPTFSVCLVFVVCFVPWHTAKGDVCRVPDLRRVLILREHGKGHVCRVPIFCRVLVLRAQGKGHICRVPEIVHTANGMAHGEPQVFGSACAANLRLLAMGHSHQRGWR